MTAASDWFATKNERMNSIIDSLPVELLVLGTLGCDAKAVALGVVIVILQLVAPHCDFLVCRNDFGLLKVVVVFSLAISQIFFLAYISRKDGESKGTKSKAPFVYSWSIFLAAAFSLVVEVYVPLNPRIRTILVAILAFCCIFHFISCYYFICHEAVKDLFNNKKIKETIPFKH
ncbi:hypothetical protein DM860_018237 [Cuscuta australis]|uniref:Uncharacterized protein n=1 Tax=Cuscuta australis TaxID=267555 RepID=A0A328DV36_9ASTE|nr:hypothetical protein DM860_018237 [Cuscuta australis]